eukprot:COSAG02_NODE_20492_length_829_cov_0.678082_1_plen_276_part_11
MLQANYSLVGGATYGKWGDWNPAYPSPRDPSGHGPPFTRTVSHITAGAMVVQNFMQVADMAQALGHLDDAAKYTALIPTLKQQYHEAFFDPHGKVYGDGTPTAFGAALWLEVTPPELLPEVVENFVRVLHSMRYRMVSVGFIGVRYIFEALAKVNRTDVALRMLHTQEYPSFGWCISNDLENAVRKSLLCAIFIVTPKICLDRLGTHIGKAEKTLASGRRACGRAMTFQRCINGSMRAHVIIITPHPSAPSSENISLVSISLGALPHGRRSSADRK